MLYGKTQIKQKATAKKTRQGQGQHSKPNHGRKKSRGQGK